MVGYGKRIIFILAMFTLFMSELTAYSGLAKLNESELIAGRWIASDGARLTIKNENGLLEIWGEDQQTNFHLNCIPDEQSGENSVRCEGRGYNHIEKKDFMYECVIKISVGKLNETWTAKFWDESNFKAVIFTGAQEFERIVPTR